MIFYTADLRALFHAFAARMQAERDHLCQLDGEVGDADHGDRLAVDEVLVVRLDQRHEMILVA